MHRKPSSLLLALAALVAFTSPQVAPAQSEVDEQQQLLANQVALGRLGAVEDIAHAVAFLASPQASYITGETLHVNGGMYMV